MTLTVVGSPATTTHFCVFIPFSLSLSSLSSLREGVKKDDVIVKESLKHHSQTDAAKGFGGKYGVLKDRQDKVC